MSRAVAEVLEINPPFAGAYEEEHELELFKVVKDRKARIYEAEIMSSCAEEESD